MQDYKINELADFINAINKNTDAAVKISVDRTSGIVGAIQGGGLYVEITPPARPAYHGGKQCESKKHGK